MLKNCVNQFKFGQIRSEKNVLLLKNARSYWSNQKQTTKVW